MSIKIQNTTEPNNVPNDTEFEELWNNVIRPPENLGQKNPCTALAVRKPTAAQEKKETYLQTSAPKNEPFESNNADYTNINQEHSNQQTNLKPLQSLKTGVSLIVGGGVSLVASMNLPFTVNINSFTSIALSIAATYLSFKFLNTRLGHGLTKIVASTFKTSEEVKKNKEEENLNTNKSFTTNLTDTLSKTISFITIPFKNLTFNHFNLDKHPNLKYISPIILVVFSILSQNSQDVVKDNSQADLINDKPQVVKKIETKKTPSPEEINAQREAKRKEDPFTKNPANESDQNETEKSQKETLKKIIPSTSDDNDLSNAKFSKINETENNKPKIIKADYRPEKPVAEKTAKTSKTEPKKTTSSIQKRNKKGDIATN